MEDGSDNYFATTEGQFIAQAHRYIGAAKLLTEAEDFGSSRRLQTPVLHLLCHGIELLLKFPLLRAGKDEAAVRKEFGHDLDRLWRADNNTSLRGAVLAAASVCWAEAEKSGRWPDDFSAEPRDVIEAALPKLAFLHGRDSDFALRYAFRLPAPAPRPRFLIEAFGVVADRAARNPACFDHGSADRA